MYRSLQEEEELEFELGRFANESQIAFAQSQREGFDTQVGEIEALVAKGKFVLVLSMVRYCRRTDALLGTSHHIVSTHETREEAEFALAQENDDNDETYVSVWPMRLIVNVDPISGVTESASDWDDIPF